ncbi:dynamin family protein [Streptomyces sp. PSKA30]|uniref:dynamin family protein n=1 Tax=Streptomyces sp. PSKA30 TaxID=2874597 RepID=UPI001CD106D4|nr:dynamin family protein [Streptomyces sp. PSKA30]MBZ9639524.1 dynamin family protein [Streptomyces sp. PSKA30]
MSLDSFGEEPSAVPGAQPTESPLRQRAESALDLALKRLPPGPDTRRVRHVLEQGRHALGTPMRVAVAGVVSSGKSTLVNALVGGEPMATGLTPVTFTVSVLRHADEPAVTVHFHDGRPPERHGLASLARFTARMPQARVPEGIAWVEVRGPFPYLRSFDLVDTPGFGSQFEADAQAALTALGLTTEAVSAVTADQLTRADAVLAVLNAGVSRSDADLLARLRGNGFAVSPVTCVGVLTKAELAWPGEAGRPVGDPLAATRRTAERIIADPEMARLFHDVHPVCSKVAEAAFAMGDEEFTDLVSLARTDPALLEKRLRVHRAFATRPYDDLPLPPERRAPLVGQFSQYGIALATALIREGVDTPDELRAELDRRSGMGSLREALVRHFGRRRDLIKLGRILDSVHALDVDGPDVSGGDPRTRAAVRNALRQVTDLERDELAFAELRMLRRWYRGEIALPEAEAAELRIAMGERGASVAERLGLPPATVLTEMERTALERLGHWRASPVAGQPGGRALVQVMERRYEQLCHRVRAARALLEEQE